ncbi:unnamed protein product [Amoebophrya sp. A25]|nr:unnamed protein product [Amoebophrya sp. A25]|eukprot:GSA25T00012151001.1
MVALQVTLYRFYKHGGVASFYIANERGCRVLLQFTEDPEEADFDSMKVVKVGYKSKDLKLLNKAVSDEEVASLLASYNRWLAGEDDEEDEAEEDAQEADEDENTTEEPESKSTKKAPTSALPAGIKVILENPPKISQATGSRMEYITEVSEWHRICGQYFTSDSEILYIFRKQALDEPQLREALRHETQWEPFLAKLKELYLPDDAQQKLTVWSTLVDSKRASGTPVKLYLQEWANAHTAAQRAGVPIAETLAGILLFQAAELSEVERTVVLGNIKGDFKVDKVKQAIRTATAELVDESTPMSSTVLTTTTKKCVHCGKPGHVVAQCWNKHPHLKPGGAAAKSSGKGKGKGKKGGKKA